MSEMARRGALLTASLLLVATRDGVAQSERHYRELIAHLRAERSRVERRILSADSVRRAALSRDTIRAGAFTILAPTALAPIVRQAAPRSWAIVEARYGHSAHIFRRTPLLLTQASADDRPVRAGPSWLWPPGATLEVATRHLVMIAALALGQRQDEAFTTWLRGHVPSEPLPDRARATFVDVATSPWTAVRACLAENLDGCKRALGVAGGAYADQWFDATDLSHLTQNRSPLPPYLDRGRACSGAGSSDDCAVLLRTIPVEYVTPPLERIARELLVDVALARGGAGAYERLMTTAGPIGDRLAAASGVTLDSLVNEWRAGMMRHAAPAPLPAGRVWMAFAWAILLLYLGVRSTRWR